MEAIIVQISVNLCASRVFNKTHLSNWEKGMWRALEKVLWLTLQRL